MKNRLIFFAVVISVMLPLSVFATPVTGDLDFNGSVTATLTSLNFLCNLPAAGACSSGQGDFFLNPSSTGTFGGLAIPSYGHILNVNNMLTPPGKPVSLTSFLTFDPLPGVSFTLTQLNIGTGGVCPPAAGSTCTPTDPALVSSYDPLGKTGTVFENTTAGAVAEFSVNAVAISSTGQKTNYIGVFSGTFTGETTAQVLAMLAGGGSVTVPFAAKFTPVSSSVPEAGTATLAILGLLFLAGAGLRRRFAHC
jgi:MYXO-CTERM domain-containing protein